MSKALRQGDPREGREENFLEKRVSGAVGHRPALTGTVHTFPGPVAGSEVAFPVGAGRQAAPGFRARDAA